MNGFEERLKLAIVAVLGAAAFGACTDGDDGGGGKDTGATADLAAMCDGAAGPADHQVASGFVQVAPGTPCPDIADANLEVFGCTFLEWQEITCSLERTDTDQVFVQDYYGGHFEDAATAPTTGYAVSDPVDVCWYEGVFYLDPNHPTCGRPLLDGGEPVVADVAPGASGWCVGGTPIAAELADAERRALAAWWLRAAVLEHASVASFAHFSLDLMRFGAPPDLIEGAHRAALDEIRHAQACFALASGYAGQPLRPGALGAGGLPAPAATLAALADALVREGCVGETLAAVDAAARLAGARDPAVRDALAMIVRDESAHAALAWRALRWVLAQDADGSVFAAVDAAFDAERERWTRAGPSAGVSVEAHGLLAPDALARALRRGWDDVVEPSRLALRASA